ncbi:MAG TPA: hypothetical protein V6D08_14310, partial [Candidatus Obscuribacterales bacterium]
MSSSELAVQTQDQTTRPEAPTRPEQQSQPSDAQRKSEATSPLELLGKLAQQTEQLATKKWAELKQGLEQPGDKRPDSTKTNKVEKADTLSPKERATSGVTEYTDPRTNKHYKYDSQGRVTDIETASGRKIHFEYKGNSEQPASFSIEQNKTPALVMRAEHNDKTHIKINPKTGEVSVSSLEKQKFRENGKQVEREVRVEKHVTSDGTMSTITFDKQGHRLSKDISRFGPNGEERLSRVEYQYSVVDGKINDKGLIGAVQYDAQGRVKHEYQFKNAADLERQKPSAHAEVTYKKEGDIVSEHREVYDLTSGKALLLSSSDKSINEKTGETSLTNKQYDARGNVTLEQEMTFDSSGKAVSCKVKDAPNNLDLTYKFENGKLAGVSDAHRHLTEDEAKALVLQAELTISAARQTYGIQEGARANLEFGPTPPRAGSTANGTLVWKDTDNKYTHARVENGILYDEKHNPIGKVQDNGQVDLTGPPPRSFNILTDERAAGAFHGVGSDGDLLELCYGQGSGPESRKEGFNGIFTDGKQKYKVIGGNMYDGNGAFVGHIDASGRVEFDKNREPKEEPKDINSAFKNGWRFEGNENGNLRSFVVGPDTSNGTIYLPDIDPSTGQPRLDENGNPMPPVKYEVCMGMIINPQTNMQYGLLEAPRESGGTFEGGYITTGNPPQRIPLANFTKAVFELEVLGQSGMSGRSITGVSLG